MKRLCDVLAASVLLLLLSPLLLVIALVITWSDGEGRIERLAARLGR